MRRVSARVALRILGLFARCVAGPMIVTSPEMTSFNLDAHAAERQNVRRQRETIDADMMERLAKGQVIIFSGNVIARLTNAVLYADHMNVYLDEAGNHVARVTLIGNVRITTSDCRRGTAQWAQYRSLDRRVVLNGNARLWPDEGVPIDEDIFIYLPLAQSAEAANCGSRTKRVEPHL